MQQESERQIALFAKTNFRGQARPFGIKQRDRRSHMYVVGKTGTGLTYRGYDISELAEGDTFEEVAHLILYGELPNKKQLDAYNAKLKKLRALPKSVKDVLERIPKTAHPMDVMRTGCSFLGNVEPALHAHVIPRHATEDPELRKKPVWLHDWKAAPPIDSDALALARRIAARL